MTPDQNIEQQINSAFNKIEEYSLTGDNLDISQVREAKAAILALISKQYDIGHKEGEVCQWASVQSMLIDDFDDPEDMPQDTQELSKFIKQQVSEARIDELENIYIWGWKSTNVATKLAKNSEHNRIKDRIAELKQTPSTPNGAEQGALANPSTPTALSKQADNLIEQLAAIEHERWSDWQKWLHSRLHIYPNQILLMRDDYERWDKQIATPYANLTEAEKQSDRDQVMRYWPLIEEWVNGLVEAEPLASNDGAKKPTPTAPTSVNREEE